MTKAMTLGGVLASISLLLPGAMAAAQTPAPVAAQPAAPLPAASMPGATAAAQMPGPVAAQPAAPPPIASPLAPLSWLEGCWRGIANRREFREQWLPLRGDLLVGVSHTVAGEKTISYEYLRVENRADGIYYVAAPTGASETALKFEQSVVEDGITTYTFVNPALDFPRQLSYRRQPDGWLFVTLEGKLKGADRRLIYPMRRVDCESAELIRK